MNNLVMLATGVGVVSRTVEVVGALASVNAVRLFRNPVEIAVVHIFAFFYCIPLGTAFPCVGKFEYGFVCSA